MPTAAARQHTRTVFHQVPVLPVVAPLALVALAVLLWRLHRRAALTLPRAALATALCVYGAGIVANTIFPIFLDKPSSDAPWSAHLALVPIAGYEVDDALMNIAVFVPLGIMLPLLTGRLSWWRTVLIATAVSLGIEVTQYVTAHLLGGGHLADINDFLFNVVGGAVGFAVLAGLTRVPWLAGLVRRFSFRSEPLDRPASPVAPGSPVLTSPSPSPR